MIMKTKMTHEELRDHMFDSLIELMNEARLSEDMPMFNSYARLVHECWNETFPEPEGE
jgi:hypothetical protein